MLYMVLLAMLLPWGVLFATAVTRVAAGQRSRIYRMQLEGAALVLLGTLSKWIIYDPLFGMERHGLARWGIWYDRGERGLFWIGVLLFALGYALERRPRKGLKPWPKPWPTVAWTGLLLGGGLGLLAWYDGRLDAGGLPWAAGRIAFTLGWLPFAWGYFQNDRTTRQPDELD